MATSPTTSALGAVGDLGRPAVAKAPTRADNNAEKSSFSDVFQDAQGSRPEPQRRSITEKAAPSQTSRDDEKAHSVRGRNAALSGNKTAATAATPLPTGKDLPPTGDSLPATLDQLLTDMSADKETSPSRTEDDKVDCAADCVPAVPVATPGIAVVLPENSVTAAAAALASRSGQVSGDDGQPSSAVGDVTSTQKREIPAAAQTLNATAALPGEINSAEALPTDVAPVATLVMPVPTESLATTKASVAKSADAKKTAEAAAAVDASSPVVATVATTGMTTATTLPNAIPADTGIVTENAEQSVTLEKMTAEKTPGAKIAGAMSGGDNSSAVLTAGDASVADGAIAGIPDKAVETERGSFRDTLKQLDSTLAPSSSRSDTTPVSATRDSGLRQYIDSAATAAKVDVPVGKAGWSDAVAGKVMWMSSQNLSSAEIQMNPADLGPLSVRVSSHQDQTSIYFTSPHASVREALDQSLPRLREMMGNQGIQLQDVGVGGQGSMREQRAFSDSGNGGGSRGRGSRDAEIDTEIGSVTRATTTVNRPGLLDAYA